MSPEQLIALAVTHGGDELMDFDNCVGVALDAVALRSLLQVVADASYERAAMVSGQHDGLACYIRDLKGTLPEMEQGK